VGLLAHRVALGERVAAPPELVSVRAATGDRSLERGREVTNGLARAPGQPGDLRRRQPRVLAEQVRRGGSGLRGVPRLAGADQRWHGNVEYVSDGLQHKRGRRPVASCPEGAR
jgi:hypothetical protein